MCSYNYNFTINYNRSRDILLTVCYVALDASLQTPNERRFENSCVRVKIGNITAFSFTFRSRQKSKAIPVQAYSSPGIPGG
jgi:phage head maturation protease